MEGKIPNKNKNGKDWRRYVHGTELLASKW